jgi:hypothetical protein
MLARSRSSLALLSLAAAGLLGACSDDDSGDNGIGPAPTTGAQLANRSVTPALIKNLAAGARAFTLVSSDDTLSATAGFIFGGSADGAGMIKNPDGTFTLLTNHEDNFAVSRLVLDKDLKPVRGDYIMTSNSGRWRLCSATMATPEEHGYGPLFFTVGESGIESQTHAVNPLGTANSNFIVEAFGRWNAENAVPLPRAAYPGRTIVLIGDDDSGTNGGQMVMYRADREGDLNTGRVHVLARVDGNIREMDIRVGQPVAVEFKDIGSAIGRTGAQLEQAGVAVNMLQFGRVEDIDYRKGSAANAREIYFNTTGQNNTGINASYTRSKYGRVYKLVLDANDPTKGTLEVILDGDDRSGPAREFQNPDNIYVGTNYLYTQEDPNGYGDETHDARIYQYNLTTKAFATVMELDHRRTASDAAKYNVGGASRFGSWEFGAMIDVSEAIGVQDAFIVAIQPHTWRGARYRGVDGGSLRPNEDQASQLIVVTGLPR